MTEPNPYEIPASFHTADGVSARKGGLEYLPLEGARKLFIRALPLVWTRFVFQILTALGGGLTLFRIGGRSGISFYLVVSALTYGFTLWELFVTRYYIRTLQSLRQGISASALAAIFKSQMNLCKLTVGISLAYVVWEIYNFTVSLHRV
jgi:hypothetical protein